MPQLFINNWASTLSSGIDTTVTTINVGAVPASDLTSATTTNYYYLTIDDDTNIEIVKVIAANGSTGDLTVVRGQDGTTGTAFSAGSVTEIRVTADGLADLQNMPDTHVDNEVLRGNLANSKKLQTSGVTIDDDGNLAGHGASINAQTGTTYTLAASDNGKVVTLNNAAAITLTLPQQSTTTLAGGFQCAIVQRGVGQVTVAKEGTDVIESKDSNLKLAGQYSSATVVLLDTTTQNTWGLYGDLTA